jgi:preprotein translocase subunit SecG
MIVVVVAMIVVVVAMIVVVVVKPPPGSQPRSYYSTKPGPPVRGRAFLLLATDWH